MANARRLTRIQHLISSGDSAWLPKFATSDVIGSWTAGSNFEAPSSSSKASNLNEATAVKTCGADDPSTLHESATGDLLFHVNLPSSDCVNTAVSDAAARQQSWAKESPRTRSNTLYRIASEISRRGAIFAALESLDTGRPLREMAADVDSAVEAFEWMAGQASGMSGLHVQMGGNDTATVLREPLGVCAGIGAWNYPLQGAAWKASAAMAFGNSILFKPAEDTPLTALYLAQVVEEIAAPGLLQVLLGAGETGRMLVDHDDIAKVSFTGAATTGAHVYQQAAKSMKRVTMELGGKSPLIVFGDADIESAARAAIMANFYSNGQVCSNGTRVFVHASIHDAFVARVIELAQCLKVGDPLDMQTDISAMVHQKQADSVGRYIVQGQLEGAQLVSGGESPPQTELPEGLISERVILPTIFTECTDDMSITKEEIFGPVMSVLRFDEVDEVVQRANNTPYGLSAGVFSKDIGLAQHVIAQLQAGTTWINQYNLAPVCLPWGGYKKSGLGRENGSDVINHWTQLKSVYQCNDPWEYHYATSRSD